QPSSSLFPYTTLFRSERLGEKNGVGIFLAHAFDQILPESDWFGVRIIHTKDAHPARGPKQNDALHLRPEVAPVFAVKIQWINIRSEEHTSELQSPYDL